MQTLDRKTQSHEPEESPDSVNAAEARTAAIDNAPGAERFVDLSVDTVRPEVDAAYEAIDQPVTDANKVDVVRPGHVEVARTLGVNITKLRVTLQTALEN